MRRFFLLPAALIAALLTVSFIWPVPKIKAGDKASYQLVPSWLHLPDSAQLSSPTGLALDTSGRLLVFHRAGRQWPLLAPMPKTVITEPTVLVIDTQSGKLLRQWGDHRFIMPHGLTVDEHNNVWVTDVGLQQVFKFNTQGKLLLTLGTAGVAGRDRAHFNEPTDVAVRPDGSFYVSDGYGNSRIIQFSAQGKFVRQWSTKGSAPGQLNVPHALTLDQQGRLYVADRQNCRIQIFDSSGHLLNIWSNPGFGHLCSVCYDKMHYHLIAVDDAILWWGLYHQGSDVIVLDSTGRVLSATGKSGGYSGPKCWYHDVTVDREGNVYVGDILGGRLQKFSPVSKAVTKRKPQLHVQIPFGVGVGVGCIKTDVPAIAQTGQAINHQSTFCKIR